MSISTEELIAINGLLIEREGAYARVSNIEQDIEKILGGEYPFPTPEAVPPSHHKRKPNKKPKTKATKKAHPKLRRLKTGEYAYQITWLENGTQNQQTILQPAAIDTLIKDPLPNCKLLHVATLDANSQVVEQIYTGS